MRGAQTKPPGETRSTILAGAIKVSIIITDGKFTRFMQAIGFPVRGF